MGKLMKYTVELCFDEDADDPCKWGEWQIVSFNCNHISFQDPYKYLGPLDEYGEPIPATIGMRRKLECGTAFILSCYQHSGTIWSLKGEGHQCPWDTARIGGLIMCKDPSWLPKDYERRKADARGFLETYNAWCNGDVYGYAIRNKEGEVVDSCWGYFESDYMLERIADFVGPDAEIEWEGEAEWLAKYFPVAA